MSTLNTTKAIEPLEEDKFLKELCDRLHTAHKNSDRVQIRALLGQIKEHVMFPFSKENYR